MTFNAGGNVTRLILDNDTTLNGGGMVTLVGTNAQIAGGFRLTNFNNTIQGFGNLGANSTEFLNQANGIIAANVGGQTLFVDPSANGFVNQGLLEATGAGILQLSGNAGGAFLNTGATILANGANSEVQLLSNVSITGGILSALNGGVIRTLANQSVFLTNLTIANNLITDNNADTHINGTITNNGTITLNAATNVTRLFLDNDTRLTGGGTVTLASLNGSSNAQITGGFRLTNVDNLIQGEGNLGVNSSSFTNQASGVINANINGRILFLDPSNVANAFVNQGLLEATNGGILQLSGNAGGAFTNTGATILANGANAEVQLLSNVSITGGILSALNGGVIRTLANQSVFLTNLTIANNLITDNNADTHINGTITNNGTITLNAAGNVTRLFLDSDTTLNGGGTVTLASLNGSSNAQITGGFRLTNVDNLIQGEGNLGVNSSSFTNQASGVINANINGRILFLDPSNVANAFVNQGLLEATNGGILQLSGNAGGAFTNTGATILANGANAEVQLLSNVSITGGILSALNGGVIRTLANQSVFLTNLTIANNLITDNNADTHINGTITNNGTITLNAAGNVTRLFLDSDTTLNGGGTVTLASLNGSSNAQITGGFRLTNVDNLIQGEGNLGANSSSFTNQTGGVINANISGRALFLDPSNVANAFVNLGLLEATNGGLLQLSGNAGGAFTNTNGTILANGAGSEVQLLSSVSITGGTLNTLNGGVVRNLAGQVAFLSNLTNAGTLITDNNADTHVSGTITNSGTMAFNAAGNVTRLFLDADTMLTGGGTITLAGVNAQITGGSRLTNVNNLIQGQGNLGANSSSFTNQSGGVINANVNGQVLFLDPANVANAFVNAGLMEATNGGILQFSGNAGGDFTNSGTIRALTNGVLRFDGNVSSSGTVDIGSNTLTATGNYTQTAGTFHLTGGTVQSNNALNFQGGLVDAFGTISAAIMNNAMLRPGLGGSGLAVTGNISLLGSSQLIFQIGGRGIFNNNGTFLAQNNNSLFNNGGTGGVFNNVGTFTRNTGTGTFTIGSSVVLNNSGVINVNSGTLQLSGGDTGTTSGDFNVAAGATLLLNSNFTFGASSDLAGAGVVNFSSGTQMINGTYALPDLNLNGSTLTSNIGLNVGAFNFSSGSYTSGQALNVSGLFTWGSGSGVFNNVGTFTRNTGTGTFTIGSSVVLNNSGVINVNSGTLQLSGGDTGTTSGDFNVAAGATLLLNSNFTFGASSDLAGAGVVNFSSGTQMINGTYAVPDLNLNGSTLTSNIGLNVGAFNFSSGSYTSGQALNVSGLFTWGSGTLTGNGAANANGGLLINNSTVNLNAKTLNNAAGQTATLTGAGAQIGFQNGGIFNNNGTFLAQNNNSLFNNGGTGGVFNNVGTFTRNTGTGTFTIGSNVAFNNSGTVNATTGTLVFNGGYTQTNGMLDLAGGNVSSNSALQIQGGLLTGFGMINAAVSNNAMLRPGLAPGGLVVGGNVGLLSASQLIFQLGGLVQGSEYGFIGVNGTVSLGGQLVLSFVNGFQASGSDSFTLMSTNGLSGSFTNIASGGRLTTTDGSGSFLVDYSGNQLVISAFVPAGMAIAANWTGTSGNWSDATNWDINPSYPNNGQPNPNDVYDVTCPGGTITLDLPVTIQKLTLSGGQISGANSLTINQLFTWTGGVLGGASVTDANGGILMNGSSLVVLDTRTLNNAVGQTAMLTGGATLFMQNGSVFNNDGTFLGQNDNGVSAGSGGGTFNNSGTLTRDTGTGTFTIGGNITFNNTGLVNVQSGTLRLAGGDGGITTGNFTVASGAALEFANSFTLAASSAVSGAGAVNFTFGTQQINGSFSVNDIMVAGGTANFNTATSVQSATLNSGTIGGSGAFDTNGLFTWSGGNLSGTGTFNANGGTLMTGNVPIVLNTRTLNLAAGQTTTYGGNAKLFFQSGAIINNAGTFLAQNDNGFTQGNAAAETFNNSGTFTRDTGTGTFTVQNGVAFNNSGTVNANSGVLAFNGGYTQTAGTTQLNGGDIGSSTALAMNGGLLTGFGNINAAIMNNAMLRPGFGAGGLAVNGNLTLLSSSQLIFQLGGLAQGTQYGFVNVSGNASLGGQLVVSFVNGFVASNGDNFTVLSATSPLNGAFVNVASGGRLDESGGAGSFLVDYNGNTIVLSDFQLAPGEASSSPGPNTVENVGSAARNHARHGRQTPSAVNVASITSGEPFAASSTGNHRAGRARSHERTNRVTINVQNSDQIADLLEGADTTRTKGKVIMNATRAARAARHSHGGNARGILRGAGNAATSRKFDRAGNPHSEVLHRHENSAR